MRILAMVAAFTATVALSAAPTDPRSIVAERVMSLTRSSSWKPVASVPMKFRAFHPQGMVKIGETLFVSSVDGARDAAQAKRVANLMHHHILQLVGDEAFTFGAVRVDRTAHPAPCTRRIQRMSQRRRARRPSICQPDGAVAELTASG